MNKPKTAPPPTAKSRDLPVLYIKTGCPWCAQAMEVLDATGIGYRQVNVSEDSGAFGEMQRKSGQNKAPTLDWHGKILADFGADELRQFLRDQNVTLEDS